MDVILLHNGHQRVSATHVAVFRVVRTRIQTLIIMFRDHFTVQNSYDFFG